MAEQRDYSEEVAEQIDAEVRRLVNDALAVYVLMTANLDKLHAIARELPNVKIYKR